MPKRLIGQRFGSLTIIGETGDWGRKSPLWECKCECGNVFFVEGYDLMTGNTKDCGCMERKKRALQKELAGANTQGGAEVKNVRNYPADLTGERFGDLVVTRVAEKKGRYETWECKCDCGNTVQVFRWNLLGGRTKSCGCMRKERVAKNQSGMRFGNLTAVRPTEKRKKGLIVWECKCDCGKIVHARSGALTKHQITSCDECTAAKSAV